MELKKIHKKVIHSNSTCHLAYWCWQS